MKDRGEHFFPHPTANLVFRLINLYIKSYVPRKTKIIVRNSYWNKAHNSWLLSPYLPLSEFTNRYWRVCIGWDCFCYTLIGYTMGLFLYLFSCASISLQPLFKYFQQSMNSVALASVFLWVPINISAFIYHGIPMVTELPPTTVIRQEITSHI